MAAPLPEDVQAVLEDAHSARIEELKAQAEFNQSLSDGTYETAAAAAAAKETRYSVRRGGEMAKVQNAKLKPGEVVFVKRPSGEFEASAPHRLNRCTTGFGNLHMNFRPEKQERTKAVAKFHILNARGELCGSVNVPPAQEADLLKHWRPQQAAPAAANAAAKAERGRAAIANALLRGPRLSKKVLLRS